MAGMWRKTLVYLGLAEEDEELEGYGYDEYGAEPARRRPARRAEESDGTGQQQREAVVRAMPTVPSARFHLVHPGVFNDAQEVGDKFREGYSVLVDLNSVDGDLRQRLIDFASGLAYGLHGKIKRVADHVYLITPQGVEVSAEERQRFLEERGFFNQA
jgi:cell division inhibitor SepF